MIILPTMRGLVNGPSGGGSISTTFPTDLGTTQGENGWTAGYFTTHNDPSTFSTSGMSWFAPYGLWIGPDPGNTPFVGGFGHPSTNGGNSDFNSVAAYSVPASAVVDIELTGYRYDPSSGPVIASVWLNGSQLGALPDSTSSNTLSLPGVSVAPGDVIYLQLYGLTVNSAEAWITQVFSIEG